MRIKELYNTWSGFSFKSKEFSEKGIPLIRIGDLKNNVITTDNKTVFLPENYIREYSKFVVKKNDILIAMSGATIGKFAIYEHDSPALLNQRVAIFRSNQNSTLMQKYLFYYLFTANRHIRTLATSSAIENITLSELQNLEVYIPKKKINIERIVTILDRTHNLIQKRQQTIDTLDQLVKSVFLNMFGDPIINKQKFRKTKLSKIGEWKSGGTPPRKEEQYFTGDIPWFSSGELNEIFITESKETITNEAIQKTSAKLVKKGSILLGMYDTAALKSSITNIEASCNQAIAFSKLDKNKCNTLFVYYAIQLSKLYYLNKRQGVRQKNLNLSKIKNIEIPLPRKMLQDRFAELAMIIYKIKSNLQKSNDNLNILFQSLLQKAFKGELEFEKEKILEDILPSLTVKELLSDIKLLNALLGKLQKQEFKTGDNYKIAQNLLFEILDTENPVIYQQYNIETENLDLKNEAN